MAVRRLADEQPADFAFTAENLQWAKAKIAEYPDGRAHSAIIPLLWRAQEQHDRWLPEPAIRYVADLVDMPYIRALEIATFYTMFQLKPVGSTAHVQVCGTTPCMLRGAEDLIAICRKRIAPEPLALSDDGAFSWEEVECAGACVNAPMVQVGADTFEDLTVESFEALLDGLASGNPPAPGPQSGRKASEPIGGLTSLTEDPETLFRARGGAAAPDGTPKSDVDPTTPEAQGQDAAKPNGADRVEVEQSRSHPEDPASEEPVAPSAQSGGTVESAPDAPEKQKDALAAEAAERQGEAPADTSDEGSGADAGAPDARDQREQVAIERADRAGTRPTPSDHDTERDDLKAISGIGPVLEKRLNGLGVFTFAQIAAWNEDNVAWVDSYLAFKGRIARERWIEQARDLVGKEGADGPG